MSYPDFTGYPRCISCHNYGCRFIAAGKCMTKPLSGILTSCFTTILTHFKEYCDGIYRNTGVNAFLDN